MLEMLWEAFKVTMFIVGCGATLFMFLGVGLWLIFYKDIEGIRDGKE